MNDLIGRQAAIDAIHNLYAIHGSEGSWIDQKDAFKALNSLPSAQPTVDAIPISWLEDLHKTAQSEEADRMIDEIISLWEARKNE